MESETHFKDLGHYFKEAKSNKIEFKGDCHDCKTPVTIKADLADDGKITVSGGALYLPDAGIFCKCDKCYANDPTLRNFQPCDVYSRVVGYLRPVGNWNSGKQAEWKTRKDYNLPGKNFLTGPEERKDLKQILIEQPENNMPLQKTA